jgi:hypothetical protein
MAFSRSWAWTRALGASHEIKRIRQWSPTPILYIDARGFLGDIPPFIQIRVFGRPETGWFEFPEAPRDCFMVVDDRHACSQKARPA